MPRRNPLRARREVEPIQPPELTQLLDWVINHRPHPRNLRDAAMYLLMADGGLRLNELLTLSLAEVYKAGEPVHTIQIDPRNAKYGSGRMVPLSSRCHAVLTEYGRVVAQKPIDGSWPAFAAVVGTHKFMTHRAVQKALATACKNAGIGHYHPHQLRHHCGTQLAKVTSLHVVKKLLGHRSISTTQIYTHATLADVQQAMQMIGKEK